MPSRTATSRVRAAAAELRSLLRDPGPGPLVRDLRHWFRETRRPVERRNRLDDDALRRLIAFGLAPDANCVDVGAHAGDVLADLVRCAPRGRHVAFEPLPELAADLRRRFPEVRVEEAAVADEPGRATFTRVVGAPALSGLRDRSDGAGVEHFDVRLTTLDEALPADYVPALIKIDVEGGELGVLRGAVETLRRHRPVVVFEHGRGGAAHYGTRPEDVFALLVDDVGLRIYDLDGGGPYDVEHFAAEAFAERGGRWNWVARP